MPRVARLVRKYLLFRAWRGAHAEPSNVIILKVSHLIQCADSLVHQKIIALEGGQESESFLVHNGVLVFRPPVVSAFDRFNLSGVNYKVVLPASMVKEYAVAVHEQMGHVGE
jgi:hypothetical protein